MVQTEHPHSFCRSVLIFVYALVASGLSLTSANQLVKPYFTPSSAIGQGGRWVWEGEAPCLAAQCNTGRLCVEGLEPAIALHVVNLLYKYSQEKRRERLSQCFLRGKYDSLLSV